MIQRQETRQQFEESGANLFVGNIEQCPMSPQQLALTTRESPDVVQTFNSGLTAAVYRVSFNRKHYKPTNTISICDVSVVG